MSNFETTEAERDFRRVEVPMPEGVPYSPSDMVAFHFTWPSHPDAHVLVPVSRQGRMTVRWMDDVERTAIEGLRKLLSEQHA